MSKPNPPTMPAGLALVVSVLALLLALMLNSGNIVETARRQPFGAWRSFLIGIAEPIADASSLLRLDRPRILLDTVTGRGEPEPLPAVTTTTIIAPTTTTAMARIISAADPLRVFVGGDSMVGQFGPMLERRSESTTVASTEVRYEFSSGLTRTDFVDWPVIIAEVEATQDPEVIVVVFGGNDAQDMPIAGKWEPYGTDAWFSEYRRRVGTLMDQMIAQGSDVWWVGMPIPRSESFAIKLSNLNRIYQEEAEARDTVHFVDSWTLFLGVDGGYEEFLPDTNGKLVDMRLDDGVHLTTAGGIKLAEAVWTEIAADRSIPD